VTRPTPPCRSCGSDGLQPFLDLGSTPLADALVSPDRLDQPEDRFPLEVAYCGVCHLVQILEEVPEEKLFVENYLYFSSFSDHLLDHSAQHAKSLIAGRDLDESSLVVELASNDGYLLRNFVEAGIPVLGIDPAPDQAAAARAAGIPTLEMFFSLDTARQLRAEHGPADVVIANNVMAHVPDLNGFVAGMAHLLADDGVITVENPCVSELVDRGAFDTIYHEHFCYFSCLSVDALVRRHGLFLNDVEYFVDLHGGTLRWHIGHREEVSDAVRGRLEAERRAGLDGFEYYRRFGSQVASIRHGLLDELRALRHSGASIAAYGAAAKGATLLNSVGIGTDLVEFVVDRNTYKQGRHMPGTHQPILGVEALNERRPDYVLLLAWNFAEEILAQQSTYLDAGGRFILPVPEVRILP
jgi:SAM-dependent methyltransferase